MNCCSNCGQKEAMYCQACAMEIEGKSRQSAGYDPDDLKKLEAYARRYQWMRERYEWRRSGEMIDEDSHAFVGCRFPYLANFSCAAMLDHNIDKMMSLRSPASAKPDFG